MLKFLATIVLLLVILEARSQNCVVKSFRWEDSRDVKSIPMPMKDLSGKKLAVIKIENNQKEFDYKFGLSEDAVATVEKEGETWLINSRNTKSIFMGRFEKIFIPHL